MDSTIVINLFLVAVFIGLTAFFVGGEFAILKVRMSRIDQLIAEGNKRAVLAKKVAGELDYYLSACQLGITITALVLGALGEPTVERMLHPLFESMNVPAAVSTAISYTIALSVITFLHVVIGELAPKTLAILFSEKMTLLLAAPLYWFGKIAYPAIVGLNGSARVLLRLFGVKPAGHETAHSNEELKWIVDQSYESGEINKTELDYLTNIFRFDDRIIRDIMLPAEGIVSLDPNVPLDELIHKLKQYQYTRYPIKDGDGFIGFIHSKEVLTSVAVGKHRALQQYFRDLPTFYEMHSIRDVLLQMQKNRVHMGIVKSENNEVVGLVTMEDILEEIVGDIEDEFKHLVTQKA